MRIKENMHEHLETYSNELHGRVLKVFQFASQIAETKKLLTDIREETVNLRELFWTEEELKKRREAVSFFDARMQATVYYTLRNIEGYLHSGWKSLIDEGDNSDARDDSIPEEK